MRRRRLEIIDRGGIGICKVARQLFDSLLHLRRIACLGRFGILAFQWRAPIRGMRAPEALLKRGSPDFDLGRGRRTSNRILQIGSRILNNGSTKISGCPFDRMG